MENRNQTHPVPGAFAGNVNAAEPVKQSGLRRRVAGMLLALVVAVASVGSFPAPASAASGFQSCFVHTNGAPYNSLWGWPAHVWLEYQVSNGSWYTIQYLGQTAPNGCLQVTIPSSSWLRQVPLRVRAVAQVNQSIFTGVTGAAPAGNLYYNLGTGIVYKY